MPSDNSSFPAIFILGLKQLGIALLYLVSGYAVLHYFTGNSIASVVWPGSGLALAALLIGGRKYLWGVFLGALAVNLLTKDSFVAIAGTTLAGIFEVTLAVWLVTRDGKTPTNLKSLSEYLRLILLGGGVAGIVGAGVGAMSLLLSGAILQSDFFVTVTDWWMGDTLGVVLVTPFALAWWQTALERPNRKQLLEMVLLVVITFATGQALFFNWFGLNNPPDAHLMLIFVVWAAIRMGIRGAASVVLMIALQGIFGALQGVGDFAHDIAGTGHRDYWLYVLTLSVVGTALATYVRELKLKELNLRHSESHLRLCQTSGGIATWEADLVNNRQWWSENCFSILGFPALSEPTWEDFLSVVHPEDRQRVIDATQSHIAQGTKYDVEFRTVGQNGAINWMRSTGQAERDAEGKPILMRGISQTITEIRLAEDTLRFHSNILASVAEGIFLIRPSDGVIIYTNPQFERMFGYEPEELIGKHVSIVNAPTEISPDAMASRINKELERAGIWSGEVKNISKYGMTFWCHVIVSTLDHPTHGRVWVAAHDDISERKKTRIALEESLEYSNSLIRFMQDGFSVLDSSRCIVDCNPALCSMTGFSREELLGICAPLPYWPPEEYETILAALDKTRKGEVDNFEFTFMRKSGERFPVIVGPSVIKDDEGNVISYTATVKDISERKQAEIALKESEKMLIAEVERRARIEQAIRHVAAAVSFETGEGFFQCLVAELSKLFGADYAFVGVQDRLQPQTINTLSVYAHGKHVDNMSYSLEGTPCANVVGKRTCVHLEQVAEQFPQDRLLVDMGVESYIGSPMFDAAGQSLGLIVVLDGKPMKDTSMVVEILDIFAARAAAEIQRLRDEQQLRIAAATFESQEGVLITDADNIILRTNRAFTNITGYSADEVIGKNPRIFKSGRHDADFHAAMWESINRKGNWEGEIWNRRKNGEIYPEHLSVTAVKDSNGILMNYVATHTDITLRKEAEDEIRSLAFYDPLTHLPNRRLLQDRLKQALASSVRSGRSGALLFIDLDNFKTLNDTLGHDIGDMLLQQVAKRLESCLREGDTVARLGGDEFVVILEGLSKHALEAAALTETICEKMLAAFEQPYVLAGHEYHCTTSIGATLFDNNHHSADVLLKQADIAMYQAKKAGRDTLRFFDLQMQESITDRVAMEDELHKALEGKLFRLYYQIQVDSSNRPLGAEALIRWLHPERGLVSPLQFIPLAEETGLIIPIGQWVLETACAQIKSWQKEALTLDLVLAVNVSAKQFRQVDFAAKVKDAIQRHAINPMLLKLELTESLLLENIEETIVTMNALNEIGVQLSLDDFGTGYSSLQYLKQLPLDQLKIDQSFVRDIVTNSSDKAIVHTIIAMAHSLGFDVIAEGVETEEQRQLLLKSGCTHFQGYLFGRPVPIEQFKSILRQY